jgi:hypothetical protein
MAKTLTDIRSKARAHTDAALNCLVGIVNQSEAPPAARVAAANSLLDRGWGKPAQPIDGDGEGGPIAIQAIVRKIIDPKSGSADS